MSNQRTGISTLLVRLGALALLAASLAITAASGPATAATGVTTDFELIDAFASGGDLVLEADITIDEREPVVVGDGHSVILDLNGHHLQIDPGSDNAGIGVPDGTELTIRDSNGDGSIEIHGEGGAGIGGAAGEDAGRIVIAGGRLDITSDSGAAIGGGSGGDGGTITINDGTHELESSNGAAIGGGYSGDGGSITIDGGTHDLESFSGAAIGGGSGGGGGEIVIAGGRLDITSDSGAAIGGGSGGDGGTITINDGTIEAEAHSGAGIGGGQGGNGGTITIDGGDQDTRSSTGAAIGGGRSGGNGGTITINDGTIDATAIGAGAAIGGNGATITINDGTIDAAGSTGAGIGSGQGGDGATITINDGTIDAKASWGAAIGGGEAGGTVTIGGGTVRAHGGMVGIGAVTDPGTEGADVVIGTGALVEASADGGRVIGGADARRFGSLENAGTLVIPAANVLAIPAGIEVDNSGTIEIAGTIENAGLIRGDGELIGDGEIENTGSIWHTMTVSTDVVGNDRLLAFDANGGTGGPSDLVRIYAATLADAGHTFLTEQPTRAGHDFAGWFDQPDIAEATGLLDENSQLSNEPAEAGEPVEVTWFAGWIADLDITATDLPDGQVDEPYDATLTATGGITPHTWTLIGGDLPDGLTLDPDTGTIHGTPTQDGTFTVTIRVTDTDQRTADVDLELVIDRDPNAPVGVSTGAQLAAAFAAGDDVVLEADITIDEDGPVVAVGDGHSVVLDLDGHHLDIRAGADTAGIGVPEGTELAIRDSGGGGSIELRGDFGAGIGGADGEDAGRIVVEGGFISSYTQWAAGIGGGHSGHGGEIVIDDGRLDITSAFGAAIGGGSGGDGGDLVINGGTHDLRSTAGAGIGGGENGDGGDITINHGTIRANGGWGAGIGGGENGDGGDITINGGTHDLRSTGGAGIGGGYLGAGGTITITDGTIESQAGWGAGIGGGEGGDGGTVTIVGGTVAAHGRDVGIGGGSTSGVDGADVVIGVEALVEASADDGVVIGGSDTATFGSLENAGTLVIPAGNRLAIPSGIEVTNTGTIDIVGSIENAGLIRGDGELIGDGEIENQASIRHTMTVSADVSGNDRLLAFDANGGTGAPTDLMRVHAATLADAGLTVPTAVPIRTGHDFAGWFGQADTDGATDPLDENSQLTDEPAEAGEPVEVTWYAAWIADLSVTTTDLPDGQVDEPYETALTATGGITPHTWALVGGALPDGLALDPDTGTIHGTPTRDGTFPITIRLSDTDQRTVDVEFELVVAPDEPEPEDPEPEDPADEPEAGAQGSESGSPSPPVNETSPNQPPATRKPTTAQPLPRTGSPVAPPLTLGVTLVGLGVVIIVASRRRIA